MLNDLLGKFRRKQFYQNILITLIGDILTILLALIVAYYFLIFTN